MGFINQLIIGGSHLVLIYVALRDCPTTDWAHGIHGILSCVVPEQFQQLITISMILPNEYIVIYSTCIHCILIYIYNGDTYIHALIHNAYQCISIHNIYIYILFNIYNYIHTIIPYHINNSYILIIELIHTIIPYHINNELMARHKPSAFVSPTAPHIVGPSKWP